MADTDRTHNEEEKGLVDGKQVSRREFLKIAGVAGASVGLAGGLGGLVAACGDEEPATTTAAPTTATTGGTDTTGAPGESTTTVSATDLGREIKIGFVTPAYGWHRLLRCTRSVLCGPRQGSHR